MDNLADLKFLAETGDFSLRVPTTVLVELEGLSRETGRSSPELRGNSQAAVSWLRERPANTKCVTSKGSLLNNFSLATEEDCSDGQVRNCSSLDKSLTTDLLEK